jgi:calcineurin-like phosphoesterase family protein
MFLDIKERGRLGSFLHYQQVPEDAHIALHGHSHEIGQRYDWSDGTLLVNVCVEQFDYHPVSLVELEQEYYARKVYMETKR